MDAFAADLATDRLALALHHLRQLDLHPAWQSQTVVPLHDEGDTALAGLAVDTNDGLVVASQVARVDRQVGDLPGFVLALTVQALANRVLMTARERRVDKLADPGMAGVNRQPCALGEDVDDLVGIRQIQFRVAAPG